MNVKIEGAFVEIRLTAEECAIVAQACQEAQASFGDSNREQEYMHCLTLSKMFALAAAATVRETFMRAQDKEEAQAELKRLGLAGL